MSPDEKERQTKINPAIHRFVGEMEKAGLQVTALIFDPEGDFLIRAGNVPHQGKEFVRLHYLLSLVVANLDAAGYYEVSEAPAPNLASLGQGAEMIADRLAVLLLSMPESLLPERIREMAQQYADVRKE